MHMDVNGTRLWFDVDGPALVPDGSQMRQRPTVVLVHGGPGVYDHSYFKPDFARLAAHAQVVYLDLRGHGSLPPSGHTSQTNSARLTRPRISRSTRAGWGSCAGSTSSIS
jgi:pimeloyl-ACP methyl ester carboxylesterase